MVQKISIGHAKKSVDEVFINFFTENNFTYKDSLISSDATEEYLLYYSSDCQICFYFAEREFEVNCLFTKSQYANFPCIDKDSWLYFRELVLDYSDLSLEKLMETIPNHFISFEEQLANIKDILLTNYKTTILPNLYK